MDSERNEIHVETDSARGGSTPHIVRWILAISLLAAIVLLSIIWMTGAATQGEAEEDVNAQDRVLGEYSARRGIRAGGGDSTDSIVGENADELDAPEVGETDQAGVPPRVEN